MRTPVVLGGVDENYNSRLSRTQAINCYLERSRSGNFTRVRRAPGLQEFTTVGDGPIRAMYSLKQYIYVVSGSEFYRIPSDGTPELLGDVGGSTSLAKINANGTDTNQIIVISEGNGYLYDDSGGFQSITDPDFEADVYVASLNQFFYTNEEDSNVFRRSVAADGTDWPTNAFASAEQNPDPLVALVAQKSALWLMGTKTVEYWQTDTSDTSSSSVVLRPVVGATIQRGVGAQLSVATFQDYVFWLADDYTVWMIAGTKSQKISDLNLEYAIRGEGFGDNQSGYEKPETAEGFFIDLPSHKFYVLTFPFDNKTWIFDVSTGLWHRRESNNLDRWRARESANAFNKVFVGDYRNNTLWEVVDGYFKEGDEVMPSEIVTPAIIDSESPLYITESEINMEVGVGDIGNVDGLGVPKADPITPLIQVYYSKDGGVTFTRKNDVSIGPVGKRNQRVISRQFGRVRTNQSFVMKYRVTDDVPVVMYDLYLDIDKGA